MVELSAPLFEACMCTLRVVVSARARVCGECANRSAPPLCRPHPHSGAGLLPARGLFSAHLALATRIWPLASVPLATRATGAILAPTCVPLWCTSPSLSHSLSRVDSPVRHSEGDLACSLVEMTRFANFTSRHRSHSQLSICSLVACLCSLFLSPGALSLSPIFLSRSLA